MCRIDPPKNVLHIIDILGKNGYEAYAVGGCVRDSIMGREPKDWDITTNAYPGVVKQLFERTVDTGLKHGTVTVMLGKVPYEVTTFRIDGIYEDSRHPEHVEFTPCLEDDLKRRDFTVNAMAWSPEKGLIDPFGGVGDITLGIVRAVGDAGERFREDALRMLRAVRFAAVLGFEIEKDTMDAIRDNSSLIDKISAERIRSELTAILMSDDPMKFMLLRDTTILRHILPEIDACFDAPMYDTKGLLGREDELDFFSIGEHCLRSVAAIEPDLCLRWAMLLHDMGKCFSGYVAEKGADNCGVLDKISIDITGAILHRLKFDNKSIRRIKQLVKYHSMRIDPERAAVARAVITVGKDIFCDLLRVKKADVLTQKLEYKDELLKDIWRTEEIFSSLIADKCCLNLADLAIDGADLIRLGYNEGAEIGRTLSYLLGRVLDEPGLNNKGSLEELALEMLRVGLNGTASGG